MVVGRSAGRLAAVLAPWMLASMATALSAAPAGARSAVAKLRAPTRHLPPAATAAAANEGLLETQQKLFDYSRRAVLRGANEDARRAYELAVELHGSGRAFLLMALHHRRSGNIEEARGAFSEGILRNRTDAQLMQAWGLFESKYGHMDRAVRLLRRAVDLDPSLSSVLRWRLFQNHQPAPSRARRVMRPAGRHATAPIGAQRCAPAIAVAPEAATGSDEATADPEGGGERVPWPQVRYTVPVQNLGWRGRPERGEEAGKWYDKGGLRNGPPMNYWRQAADERFHAANVGAARALMRGDAETDGLFAALEQRMAILTPLRCRKLLGRWAPVLVGGEPVATAWAEPRGGLRVPATLAVARAGERRTMTNRYGEFDAHMDEGEPLRVALEAAGGAGASRAEAPLAASSERRGARRALDLAGDAAALLPAVGVGGVTYLSDYLWVQRDESGALADVWLRVTEEAEPPY